MTTLTNGFLDLATPPALAWQAGRQHTAERGPGPADPEFLRRVAWEIGERKPAERYAPADGHVGIAPVNPSEGFAHWRISPAWVDGVAGQRGGAWHNSRPVLRLYDVSFITFNGFNAHAMHDHTLPGLCGELFFKLARPGTWQLAEVGFLLTSGEFIPAARSQSVPFAPDSGSRHGGHAALLVREPGRVEEVGNVWDQQRILRERRQPQLRQPLRLAAFAFGSLATGQEGTPARFVTELAAGQAACGHEVHVFLPASGDFTAPREDAGVRYHPLDVSPDGSPLDVARAFARAAGKRLRWLPAFDLVHLHDWMTGSVPVPDGSPTLLSLGSVEATRRNGTPPSDLSRAIEDAERAAARSAACVLTPAWLLERAAAELGVADVRAFPMEGRLPNEWECPLDYGDVKREIGVGPVDRLLIFVGPLEHAAGPDLLLEALPVLLQRAGNLRVAFVGAGDQYGHLQHRAHEMGVAGAVRLLGHVEGHRLTRLLRAAEALVLPSRWRVPMDDAVVDLARRAGRPVVTTHGGPAHLVRHEENGVITYDNPGSMVWAVDRILGDPTHAERMGANGRRADESAVVWGEVARHYLELCAARFPGLTENTW
jgi:glycosyltransferase involved in cell wall biosynthesis